MITIGIKTDGKKIANQMKLDKVTMGEAAITILKMEQMKLALLEIPFEQEQVVDTQGPEDKPSDA